MSNCAPEPKLASFLPDFARNAHGNLAEQNRLVGPQRGADTMHPERKLGEQAVVAVLTPAEKEAAEARCHGMHNKIVGPAYTDVSRKYAGKVEYLLSKIKMGGSGVWGDIPMPPQNLSDNDAKAIAEWLSAGGPK